MFQCGLLAIMLLGWWGGFFFGRYFERRQTWRRAAEDMAACHLLATIHGVKPSGPTPKRPYRHQPPESIDWSNVRYWPDDLESWSQ